MLWAGPLRVIDNQGFFVGEAYAGILDVINLEERLSERFHAEGALHTADLDLKFAQTLKGVIGP